LRSVDVAIIDDSSKPIFGGRPGAVVEINDRTIEIVDSYTLGRGFVSPCIVIVSDQNFFRLYPEQFNNQIHLGFIRVKQGQSIEATVERLRQLMPADTVVYARDDFMQHEINYWMTSTSTGLVFGFGVGVAAVVGCAILFQTLSTLIRRNLPEYATLKAMGFEDRQLTYIVLAQALIIVVAAYVLSIPATYGLYGVARDATGLPIRMTIERMVAVFAMTMIVCLLASSMSLRALRKADPVDLF
jgi:putative ABC transport system permease protein